MNFEEKCNYASVVLIRITGVIVGILILGIACKMLVDSQDRQNRINAIMAPTPAEREAKAKKAAFEEKWNEQVKKHGAVYAPKFVPTATGTSNYK